MFILILMLAEASEQMRVLKEKKPQREQIKQQFNTELQAVNLDLEEHFRVIRCFETRGEKYPEKDDLCKRIFGSIESESSRLYTVMSFYLALSRMK